MENDANKRPGTPATEPVAAPALEVAPTEAAPAAAKKKGLPKAAKIVIGVIGGLIVLAGLGIGALFFIVNMATQAPVDASNKFVDAMQANQPDVAYGLTSSAFQKSNTEAQLASIFTRVSPLLKGDEKVVAKKIEAKNGVSQAAVNYTVENGGKTRYIRIVLQQTGSKWEVINLKTSDSAIENVIE